MRKYESNAASWQRHYIDVIMTTVASQTTSLKRLFRRRSKKISKLRVTGLCAGNSPGPVNSPHKGPVMRKIFPFDDVIMGNEGRQSAPAPVSGATWLNTRNLYSILYRVGATWLNTRNLYSILYRVQMLRFSKGFLPLSKMTAGGSLKKGKIAP